MSILVEKHFIRVSSLLQRDSSIAFHHRANGEHAFAAIESYPFLKITVLPQFTV